jgi:hypothetical protein
MNRKLCALGCLALVLASAPALAQTSDAGAPIRTLGSISPGGNTAPEYGVTSSSIYNVGADDMMARLEGWANFELFNNAEALPAQDNSTLDLSGPIHLPSGVILESAEIFYFDDSPTNNPAGFFAIAGIDGSVDSLGSVAFPATSAGSTSVEFVFPPNTVVDNETYHYSFNMTLLDSGATGHRFYRARIHYRRQVSPAPALATFSDVPVEHQFHRYVEALVASGITAGCGGGQFCVNTAVTRGQMAVFLAVALGLHFPN